MIIQPEFLSAQTQTAPDTLNDKDRTSVFSGNGSFNDLVFSAFENVSERTINLKNAISTISESSQLTGNPENLLILQKYIIEYTNYLSLISTISRKGIATIETLEKAQ
ncbi:type III secretion system inner rod subunit SctI [Erwinia piriflorinigrans]|uniref:type III secretion system inner rod subunit SctI n=1 Tax=Erwinia piriflorinigrans TaxID=665097 RepID=UPI000661577B|nr:type III secretion system inner rod subunit SctI [Erwinia piriflorinigrans]